MSQDTCSTLVLETRLLLNEASKNNFIKLRWVKAHVGHIGNELADNLAKAGALEDKPAENDSPLVPGVIIKHEIRGGINQLWTQEWQARKDCHQTKLWFSGPNKNLSEKIIRLPRNQISILIQLITGHNYLNYHQSKVDPLTDPICRSCLEDDESSEHIIARCPAFCRARNLILGNNFLRLDSLVWTPSMLLRFLTETSMESVLDPFLRED